MSHSINHMIRYSLLLAILAMFSACQSQEVEGLMRKHHDICKKVNGNYDSYKDECIITDQQSNKQNTFAMSKWQAECNNKDIDVNNYKFTYENKEIKCEKYSCSKDEDCDEGGKCEDNKCIYILKCTEDNQCGKDTKCLDGLCACSNGKTFCGKEKGCVELNSNKSCGTCENHTACTDNLVCIEEKCTEKCGEACKKADGTCIDGYCKCNDENKVFCGEKCININSKESCGTCENHLACPDNSVCIEGRCEGECGSSCETAGGTCEGEYCKCADPNAVLCSDGCINLNSDNSCGTCENHPACKEGLVCINGKCECPDGKSLCNDVCIDLNSDESCGTCEDHKKCEGDSVCFNHKCDKHRVESCSDLENADSLTLCWNSEESNICTNPMTDNNRCGCGGSKDGPNPGQNCNALVGTNQVLESSCINGKCKITCKFGYDDCDEDILNGCEVDLNNTNEHCGQCDKSCASGEKCSNGDCNCIEGMTACNGQCVNTKTDNTACGNCETKCGTDMRCNNSQCECENSNLTKCDDKNICINLSDDSSCGTCDNYTNCTDENKICDNNKCSEPSLANEDDCIKQSQEICYLSSKHSICTDPQKDEKHCGCGKPEAGQESAPGINCTALPNTKNGNCTDGNCTFECMDGYGDCNECQEEDATCDINKTIEDGCETDLRTDIHNCGTCKNDISAVSQDNLHIKEKLCENGTLKLNCENGYGDCDNNPDNGCEVKINEDNNNCGTCGNRCTGYQLCVEGKCRCTPGNINACGCDDSTGDTGVNCESLPHVNTVSCEQDPNLNNKYRCKVKGCTFGYTTKCMNGCVSGYYCEKCEIDEDCSFNRTKNKCCNGTCVDTDDDKNNCGACGKVCNECCKDGKCGHKNWLGICKLD